VAGGVVDLPAALVPWSRELAIFPREIALELGPVVRRLAALVGSAIPSRAASGEPDGFDGLARRGSYERLLHSEWLLADELPDEFARRAAMHEHLFLAVARQQRVQHPLAVALFDCGPSQLGTPRLAHIAALVVLARRAAAAEAAFRWGVLQNPTRLFDDVTAANVMSLLEARTAAEARQEHLDAWLDTLEGDAGGHGTIGELWLVGPSRLARFERVRRQWHLEIEDPLDSAKDQLRAAVRHDARHDPPVLLDLPSPDVCTRLLRDPFAGSAAPQATQPKAFAIVSNVLFDYAGHVVLGRAAGGNLVVQPFTNSPKAKSAPRARLVKTGPGVVIAAMWRRRVCHSVTLDEEGLRIENSVADSETRFYKWPEDGIFPIGATPKFPANLEPILTPEPYGSVMFVDAAGDLWNSPRNGPLEHVAGNIAAVLSGPKFSTLLIQRAPDESWRVLRYTFSRLPDIRLTEIRRQPEAGQRAFFGYGGLPTEKEPNLLALELNSGWLVIDKRGDHLLMPPPGCTVVGAAAAPLTGGAPALVLLEENQREITLAGRGSMVTQWRTNTRIAHVTVSAVRPHIAWVTEAGVEIASLTTGHRLFRSAIEPEAAP
jgi:hypothetical protein